MRRLGLALAIGLACLPAVAGAQLTTPVDWKWRQDAEAPIATGLQMKPGEWAFVQMPPGWHVTTGPGVLLYPSANGDLTGHYALETEVFLFPGQSADEYGVFFQCDEEDGACAVEERMRSLLAARYSSFSARYSTTLIGDEQRRELSFVGPPRAG